MKKLILSMVLIGATTLAFGQKKSIKGSREGI